MEPQKMNLSGIPTPKRPLTEEETGKLFLESQIVMPELVERALEQLSDIAASVSIIALYFEKKGIEEKLFTESELTDE